VDSGLLIAAALVAMSPDICGVLVTGTAGRLITAGALTLDLVGYLMIKRIARIRI
jgi:Flp pilus assembly protein TadB